MTDIFLDVLRDIDQSLKTLISLKKEELYLAIRESENISLVEKTERRKEIYRIGNFSDV